MSQIKGPYEIDSVWDISELPGVYCWYVAARLGPMEWQDESSSPGSAKRNLLTQLRELLRQHIPADLDVNVLGSFGQKWAGGLSEQALTVFLANGVVPIDEAVEESWKTGRQKEDGAPGDEEDQRPSDDEAALDVSELLDSEAARHLVVEALTGSEITPFLGPIYIGASKNLRDRVKQHKDKIEFWHDFFQAHDRNAAHLSQKNEFAARAALAGIAPTDLRVYVLEIDYLANEDISRQDAENAAFLIERILNACVRPMLGRGL